jgi:adenylate cyclase
MDIYIPIAIAAVIALILWWIVTPRVAPRRSSRKRAKDDASSNQPIPLDITVLFTNLDDFVPLFERLGHQAGARLLNEYYAVMTPIIKRHEGFIHQHAFDNLFCCFGPILSASRSNHAEQAIRAILDMQNAMDLLNDRLGTRGLPRLRMRAGIATGQAIVGDIGSAEFSQFTAIGPAVNHARQLEKACKATDARNLVNSEARLRTLALFRFRAVEAPPANEGEAPMESFEAIGRL